MRHYEIVYLVHPDQGEQIDNIIELNRNLIREEKGKVHRLENWGRRQLAYPIDKIHKAHYILMNVECTPATITKLTENFKFSDAVIRSLVTVCKKAITTTSEMGDESSKKSDNAYNIKFINYKAVEQLKNYIMETGRIVPSRVSNVSARDQRRVTNSIKVARYLALLPYCDRHE
ncbi:MAG: 30S ribosomal protein S6 [Legionellales bacterium]|mgnify:FL=1|jgi:small subunit ribosomal protein S6|nr:30S ribosomal protein S6 [Legionellales bacterium]